MGDVDLNFERHIGFFRRACVRTQFVGCYADALVEPLAHVLGRLGRLRAVVVCDPSTNRAVSVWLDMSDTVT